MERPCVFVVANGVAERECRKRRPFQVRGEAPSLAHDKQQGTWGSDQCLKATGADGKSHSMQCLYMLNSTTVRGCNVPDLTCCSL